MFQNSFRFTEKLHSKYSEFFVLPVPHIVFPISNIILD